MGSFIDKRKKYMNVESGELPKYSGSRDRA